MIKRRTHYSREFKLKAVELSYQKENITQLADDLGIPSNLIYRWRKQLETLKDQSFPGNGKQLHNEEESELIRVKRELADIRMERDILKKAIGIFSRNDGKHSNS